MKLGIIVILISIGSLIGCAPHVMQTVPPTHDVFVSSGQASGQETTTTGSAAQQRAQSPVTQPCVTPQPVAEPVAEPAPLPEKEDTFQKAGDVFAASSRFVYDSGSGTWHWVRDELREHQDTIDATEHSIGEAFDSAKKKIRDKYNKLTK
jgi:hypothetical protein